MQVDASGWPNETQVERKSKTCVDWRVRLASALDSIVYQFRNGTLMQQLSEDVQTYWGLKKED